MKDFIFHNPTKLIFGRKAMERLGENLRPLGKKIFLTYGRGSIKRNGIYDKVISQLKDFEVQEFGGIEPNPRVETVREAVNCYKTFNPDVILAVGGGSTIDASKLIASALYYDGDPWDFLTGAPQPKKYVPLATIVTLSATGSEMNGGAVITNWATHEKLFFIRPPLFPKFSILDPQNTYSVPPDQTAYGIVDAFSHVLEQYLNTSLNTPLQDRWSESILLTLIENAPIVLKDPENYSARANIMLCATMALNGLVAMGVNEDWATHIIEHELSAFYDIPHGAGLAIITPRWMKAVRKDKLKKFVQYGQRVWGLLGDDETISKMSIEKTYNFFASLNLKMTLKDWKVTNEYFNIMTARLVKNNIGERPLTREEIREILEDCL